MKRITCIILTALLLTGILLAGCSSEEVPGTTGGTLATNPDGNNGGSGSGSGGNGNGSTDESNPDGTNATDGTQPTEPEISLPGSEGLNFSLLDDGTAYRVTGIGTCTDAEVVIPATYEGLPVTQIGTNAFYGCYTMTKVTIPNTVTYIGEYAFSGAALTEIYIPASVTYIDRTAFSYCSFLTKIDVDPANAVYHSAENCLIETETKMLLRGTAAGVIPTDGSATWIGNYAFSGCEGMTDITVPDCITSIGGNAFSYCTDLESVVLPDSLTLLAGGAFEYCESLTDVTLPSSITAINLETFNKCTGLTGIVIPEGVTEIGRTAFGECAVLESITIPASVTKIDGWAFQVCGALKRIDFGGTVAQWNAINKGSYWDVNCGSYTVYCTDGEI